MSDPVLGRTNLSFPDVWLSLAASPHFIPGGTSSLCSAALDSGLPIEVSSNAALWGGSLRGESFTAIGIGNHDLETAPDERAAASAIQAHLLQILSALGRERLDFYFLRIRRSLEEVQIHGAFEAIESLRADGHIGFLGLMVDGPAMPSLGLMQFHDAFEVVLVKRTPADESSYTVIEPLARERRAGVITYGEGTEAFRSENTVLVKVASPEEIIRLR